MLLLLLACHADPTIQIHADDEARSALVDFVAFLDDPRVVLAEDDKHHARDIDIDVTISPADAGSYTLSTEDEIGVTGGDVTGAQYGVADVLEHMGYGFFHPYQTRVPETLEAPTGLTTTTMTPDLARRGLHLHTLHPIEGLAACYVPNDTDECRHIVDWLLKNRGNYLEWSALGDTLDGSVNLADWQAFTTETVDYAHGRGVDVGIGLELFGSGNLQSSFDLVDQVDTAAAESAEMDRRYAALAPIPWDTLALSFGEFNGEDPQVFIDTTNLAYERAQVAMPGVEMTAVIHVGNYDDLRVTYQGQEMLYYFLVQFANPAIRPWVHSVMYYDLYEDAGGAYMHDDFSEHRAFLEDRLATGQPVGYYPESAYWIAFDNPVPSYLPLYVRSRALDLNNLAGLQDHVLFSSGWEWGYWQNDAATLRMNYTRGPWEDTFKAMFDADTAATVIDLVNLQHDALIDHRLAAYIAGRDLLIDLGDQTGIISQPDRVTYAEIYAADATTRASFQADVVTPLAAFGEAIDALPRPVGDSFVAEVADGIDVDALRARYAAALYQATLDAAAGADPTANLALADTLFDEAMVVVTRRGESFRDPAEGNGTNARWGLESWDNPTIYDYGYLREAQKLCFWERERAQVRGLVLSEATTVPACVL